MPSTPNVVGRISLTMFSPFPNNPVIDLLNGPCPFHAGKSVWETHTAVLGRSLSFNLLQLTATAPWAFFSGCSGWYRTFHPACKGLDAGLYLVLNEVVPESFSKTFERQVALLPVGYEPPSALAEALKNCMLLEMGQCPPNPDLFARTADRSPEGLHFCVGRFREMGMYVGLDPDEDDKGGGGAFPGIGLGACRRIPLEAI